MKVKFVESLASNCARCCYKNHPNYCEDIPCIPEDREDGKEGYFIEIEEVV